MERASAREFLVAILRTPLLCGIVAFHLVMGTSVLVRGFFFFREPFNSTLPAFWFRGIAALSYAFAVARAFPRPWAGGFSLLIIAATMPLALAMLRGTVLRPERMAPIIMVLYGLFVGWERVAFAHTSRFCDRSPSDSAAHAAPGTGAGPLA